MSYTKPTVVLLGRSIEIIQGAKAIPTLVDGTSPRTSACGYEADE
jgi:hypothetical protein